MKPHLPFLIDLGYKGPLNRHYPTVCGFLCTAMEKLWLKLSIITFWIKNTKSEPELEPEHAMKKIASRRVVKKKVTLSVDENIIFDDPDAALELAKSISQTEAKEAEAARKVHTTYARIVIESISESAKKKSSGKSSKSVVIQDTLSSPKSKPATSKTKLEGAPSLTPQEQEAADIIQALKEIVSATSSEGTGTKLGVLDEDKDITKEKVILKWGDEQDSEHSDDDNDDAEKDDKYSYIPIVVDSNLDTKVRDVFQKELQKHVIDLIHKYSLQHLPELTKKPTPISEQESKKSPSEILKIKKEQAKSQKKP
ncbi:hypothetical protein Tco_0752440 [Tanacetum coccineum]|uniref:Uncharacterized protein n=1 Tax=Tanacetum coccineum TaxID=301880 RepID=A0ABQ4Z6U7_9ASTR